MLDLMSIFDVLRPILLLLILFLIVCRLALKAGWFDRLLDGAIEKRSPPEEKEAEHLAGYPGYSPETTTSAGLPYVFEDLLNKSLSGWPPVEASWPPVTVEQEQVEKGDDDDDYLPLRW
jgi:hypothetical protein